MLEDDAKPQISKPVALDLLSVEDLEARIAALRGEIAACEAAIAQKKSQRAVADALFAAPKE